MNKTFFANKIIITVVSCMVLASCTKHIETITPIVESPEIAFQTVVMPATKVLESNQNTFDTGKTFKTFAFFLENGDWDANLAASHVYVNNKEVSYSVTDNLWKTATTYYWPKTGYLTFFSYAPSSMNVSCTAAKGINMTAYDVTASAVDFMVADIAKNKTANENVFQWSGVPTLFRHKLTQVSVAVKEKIDYANGHNGSTQPYVDGDKVITLKNITISNIYTIGDYTQTSSPEWKNQSAKKDYTYFAGENKITTTLTKAGNTEIVLPQTLAGDAMITVTYDITTYVDNGAGGVNTVVEHVTISKKVKDLTASWAPGKDICYNLHFDMSDPDITDPMDPNYGKDKVIYWDPAVQDWEAMGANVII